MGMGSLPSIDLRYSLPIKALQLPNRAQTALLYAGIRFAGQLVERSEAELLRLPNLGRASMAAIKAALKVRGLELGTTIAGRPKNDAVFGELLARSQNDAVIADRGFKTAGKMITEVSERLADERFRGELKALVRKYDHAPAGPAR